MSNKFFSTTKAEESGYSDPFGDSCPNNFDIVQFINDDLCNTPVDSPLDSNRFLNIIQHQQQHPQLLLQSVNTNSNGISSQASGLLDNGLIYNSNGVINRLGNNTEHLPDSPPITDISAGGISSASPSSGGSASGGSPFSPTESYDRNYHQNGVLLAMSNNVKNGDNNLITNDDIIHQQVHLHQRILMQQQLSPQSGFLSPYPPSQSTPGSQHSSMSSAQVSPPSLIIDNQRQSANNYLLQQQLNQQQYQLYNENDISHHQIHQTSTGGYKRRRTSQNIGLSQNTSALLSNNSSFANIKSENDFFNRSSNILQQQNGNFYHSQNIRNSANGEKNISNCISQQPLSIQSQPPPPPSSHHSIDGDSDDSPAGSQKAIKFTSFFRDTWSNLYDNHHNRLDELKVHIVADKGFNFSTSDNCFVNQKKNHFQITVQIDKINANQPFFVRMPNGEFHRVIDFLLLFGGAKYEMPNAELVAINQSQADRKPIFHEGVKFNIETSSPTKLTVQRLHFSATTLCNHRKNGKPNPEQKYFLLVLKLMARTASGLTLIQAYQSDRVIVRASNPGQFEQPETETQWQRNEKLNGNVLHFNGQVAVGTDTPVNDSKLTVKGNIFATGALMHPSDRRVKENIAEIDTNEALSRIAQMRIVEYEFKPEIAKQWGLSNENSRRVGIIAQELNEIMPDAVCDNGEYLTVDDSRVFYDNIAAQQELYRLQGDLECKINQVEKISYKLACYAQKKKYLGSMASEISDFSNLYVNDNGLSNKNYMSYSRASLTSAPATYSTENKSKNKNKHLSSRGSEHKRCRSFSNASSYSYCNRGRTSDSALCNSKVTQGTIVTLVVIMALCLMAMCTLYVMDWYNRTYIYAPHHHYHPSSLFNENGAIVISGIKNDNKLPGHELINNGGEHGLGHFVEKIIWTPPKDPIGIPLAAQCLVLRSHCPVFCCGASHSSLMESVETENYMNIISKFSKLSALNIFETNEKLDSNVQIQILNLNTTIDSSYCRSKTGCDSRKGIYNLDVPVSPFLPTIPLLLKFNVEENLHVDNCGPVQEFNYNSCEFENDPRLNSASLNKPISKRISGNVFEIPVGNFMQSAFVFRIGYSSELCELLDNQLGRSFDEYKIVFYRTCGNL